MPTNGMRTAASRMSLEERVREVKAAIRQDRAILSASNIEVLVRSEFMHELYASLRKRSGFDESEHKARTKRAVRNEIRERLEAEANNGESSLIEAASRVDGFFSRIYAQAFSAAESSYQKASEVIGRVVHVRYLHQAFEVDFGRLPYEVNYSTIRDFAEKLAQWIHEGAHRRFMHPTSILSPEGIELISAHLAKPLSSKKGIEQTGMRVLFFEDRSKKGDTRRIVVQMVVKHRHGGGPRDTYVEMTE